MSKKKDWARKQAEQTLNGVFNNKDAQVRAVAAALRRAQKGKKLDWYKDDEKLKRLGAIGLKAWQGNTGRNTDEQWACVALDIVRAI